LPDIDNVESFDNRGRELLFDSWGWVLEEDTRSGMGGGGRCVRREFSNFLY